MPMKLALDLNIFFECSSFQFIGLLGYLPVSLTVDKHLVQVVPFVYCPPVPNY